MQSAHPYTNGASHHAPRAVRAVAREPFESVLGIGGRTTQIAAVAFFGAVLVHGVAAARAAVIDPALLDWASRTGMIIEHRLNQSIDVSFHKEQQQEPPKEEPKEEEPPKDDVPQPMVKEANPYEDVKPVNPPPAAQAGQVLGADDEVDFTKDGFVTGSAATYAGGSTSSKGTSEKAVRNTTGQVGTGHDQGPAQVAAGPDRSRSASLAGSSEWNCPTWPSEADAEQIDEAYVTIEVTIGADGRAQKVAVVKDPGYGFAREARACAMKQAYSPALDRDGRPIASSKQWRVRFER